MTTKSVKGAKSTKETVKETKKELQAQRAKMFDNVLNELNAEIVSKTGGKKGDVELSRLGANAHADVDWISSGSLVLDSILGGGFPKGRIIEIYGPEASGKTSIALNAIANVQREGGNAVFIDCEQALDPNYSRILGVDTTNLGFTQTSIAEHVLGLMRKLLESGTTDIIVVDSVPALIPAEEFKDPDKPTMALLPRILSKQLRVIARLASESGCIVIFLNQIRDKVGVVFGNPETTPGGKALKFYASQRIEIRRKGQFKEGTDVLGTEVRMKVIKNKVAPPFQEGLTVLTFAKGINRAAEALKVGQEFGIIKTTGRTSTIVPSRDIKLTGDISSYDGDSIKIATSAAGAVKALEQEEDLFAYISEQISKEMAKRREGEVNDLQASLEDSVESEVEIFESVLED